jgi:hypothetical protein
MDHTNEYRLRIRKFMVRVSNEHGIYALHGQVWIARVAMHNADVVLTSLNCPEPQEDKRQSADVLCQDSAAAADGWRKLQREISRAAPQIDNNISGLKVECPDDVGRLLPLIALSFDRGQTGKRVKALVGCVGNEQDYDAAQDKKAKFEAVVQSL